MDWLRGFVFAVSLYFCDAGKRTTDKLQYLVNFLDNVKDCNNFNNKVVDLSGLEMRYDSPLSTSLTGVIKVMKTIGNGDELEMNGSGYKDSGVAGNKELVGLVSGNVCKYMKDVNAPWTPLFIAMGIDSCPIEAGTYTIESFKLNLDYAEGMPVLNNQCVGEYLGIFSLYTIGEGVLEQKKQISCHALSMAIVETKVE